MAKIKPTQILPVILIIINIAAGIICFSKRDIKNGIYWIAAAILNFSVAFL